MKTIEPKNKIPVWKVAALTEPTPRTLCHSKFALGEKQDIALRKLHLKNIPPVSWLVRVGFLWRRIVQGSFWGAIVLIVIVVGIFGGYVAGWESGFDSGVLAGVKAKLPKYVKNDFKKTGKEMLEWTPNSSTK